MKFHLFLNNYVALTVNYFLKRNLWEKKHKYFQLILLSISRTKRFSCSFTELSFGKSVKRWSANENKTLATMTSCRDFKLKTLLNCMLFCYRNNEEYHYLLFSIKNLIKNLIFSILTLTNLIYNFKLVECI